MATGLVGTASFSPTDDLSAYTLIQGNEREYTAHLKQTLRNIESGLPNQQWIASVVQSFEHICAFDSKNRWTAETTTLMMSAYAEQPIKLGHRTILFAAPTTL